MFKETVKTAKASDIKDFGKFKKKQSSDIKEGGKRG